MQDEIQNGKVVLFEKREDGVDEVSRERASAKQADADQCKADGVTGQGQHGTSGAVTDGATAVPVGPHDAKRFGCRQIRGMAAAGGPRHGGKSAQF